MKRKRLIQEELKVQELELKKFIDLMETLDSDFDKIFVRIEIDRLSNNISLLKWILDEEIE